MEKGVLVLAVVAAIYMVDASCFEVSFEKVEAFSEVASELKCSVEGRFKHPNDCGGYMECVRRGGLFKRRFGSCHGGLFNSEAKNCVLPDEDHSNQCKPLKRSKRSMAIDRRYSNICSLDKNGFACADCKTAVNCVEGIPYVEMCGTGDVCARKEEFGGGVCYPSSTIEKCRCNTSSTFFSDPYDSQMFFFCQEKDGEPDVYSCPRDKVFDVATHQCVNNDLPQCTKSGLFSVYSNCSQYYTCIAGMEGWVQKTFLCQNDEMFNEITGKCEDPCGWGMSNMFSCSAEGRFPDPLSCHYYYECVAEETGFFRQHHRRCPGGYEWNPDTDTSGYCTKGSNICNPLQVSKCIIPKDWCPFDLSSATIEELMARGEKLEQTKAEIETEIAEVNTLEQHLNELRYKLDDLYRAVQYFRSSDESPKIRLDFVTINIRGFLLELPRCGTGDYSPENSAIEICLTILANIIEEVNSGRIQQLFCLTEAVKYYTEFLYRYDYEILMHHSHEFYMQVAETMDGTIQTIKDKLKVTEEKFSSLRMNLENVEFEIQEVIDFANNLKQPALAKLASEIEGVFEDYQSTGNNDKGRLNVDNAAARWRISATNN